MTACRFWWESQKERDRYKTKTQVANNIKMNLGEVEWSGMDWTNLAQDEDQGEALVNTAMNFRVPKNVGKFLSN
jgi:hypothetical protein